MRKRKKTFAQKYSTDFEQLILEIVEDSFENKFTLLMSENTPPKSDGGYDGYLLIKSLYNRIYSALIEAKLRTSSKDLPLDDFSKSIIIAINLDASYITIGTNVYFSENTVNNLKRFAYNTGLEICTIDYKDVIEWIEKHPNECSKYNPNFIGKLKETLSKNYETACRELSISDSLYILDYPITEFKLYGEERKKIQNKIVDAIHCSAGAYIIRGKNGVGKEFLAKSIINTLNSSDNNSRNRYITCEIDFNSVTSQNDFILKVISLLWGCNCDETIDFLQNFSDSTEINESVYKLLPNEAMEALSRLAKLYHRNVDMDIFFSYIASLYEKMIVNKKAKKIFLFYNIEKSIDTNMFNMIISFVRKMSSKMTIILCIPDEPQLCEKKEWRNFCFDLEHSDGIKTYDLYEWNKYNATEYIKDNIIDEDVHQKANDIIDYFGLNPANLAIALDLINKDKILLSYIQNNIFAISNSFDTKKIKSAFIFSLRNLSDTQHKILYLMCLFKENVALNDLCFILNLKTEEIIEEIESLPYLKICQSDCCWKSKIYIDLINEDETKILYFGGEYFFLQQLIRKINDLQINQIKKSEILLWIYIKLHNIEKINCLLNELISDYQKNEEYGKTYSTIKLLMDKNLLPIEENARFNLFVQWLYAAIKLGYNGEDSDLFDKFNSWTYSIENFCEFSGKQLNVIILGRFYYVSALIHLSMSNYEKMIEVIKKGLVILKQDSSEESVDLQSELCGIYATALKHLENIESAVSYLQANETIACNPEIKNKPRYIISYHTQYASLFTGSNPALALEEFMKINDVCKKYSKEAYLHNLHNISSMKFALKDFKGALKDALVVQKETYENNFSIEFGRCQNIMGCLMWQQGDEKAAKYYFISSYEHFKKHQHNTHLWAPLVNLSILCTQIEDIEAEKFTKEAFDFLIKHHLKQIKSAIIEDINYPPKIIVAILMLFYNFEHLEGMPSKEILDKIDAENIVDMYKAHIRNHSLKNLFKESAYNCDGKIMLKV